MILIGIFGLIFMVESLMVRFIHEMVVFSQDSDHQVS